MFRRKRSTSRHQQYNRHQPLPTPSQPAASAASHAFLNSQPSSTALSSAAAAAALRSITPTPQPVENVQTKRMLQRRSSIVSQPDLPRGATSPPPQTLRRVSSSSSMTNRTFRREQSPRRPPAGFKSASQDVLPPLPPMPRGYTLRQQAPGSRRSFSMGPPAPVRPISPPARAGHTRGVSVDRQITRSPTRQVPSLGSVPEVEKPVERPTSRNSINFSYPMNSRPNSPPPSPGSHRVPASASSSLARQLSPVSSQRQQVSTKDRRLPATAPTKTANDPIGAAIAAAQAANRPSAAAAVPRRQVSVPAPAPAPAPLPSRSTSSNTTAAAAAAAIRQPPVVSGNSRGEVLSKEPRNPLSNENSTTTNTNTTTSTTNNTTPSQPQPAKQAAPPVEQSPVPPIRATVTPEPQIIQSPPTPEEANVQLSNQQSVTSSPQPSNRSDEPRAEPAKPWMRQPSSSPGRSARFSTQLTAGDLRLHHPPPRSVSPVKSALKHTPHGSLSPDRVPGPIARSAPPSELSDGTSVTSDDGYRPGNPKRKSAKVSFDDEAEVVGMGVGASPPTSPEEMLPDSPPGRSRSKITWFGVGKKKPSPFDNVDDFDEVLKPRRALPSFGSVRLGRDNDIHEAPSQEEDHKDNESVTSSTSTTHDNPDDGNGNGDGGNDGDEKIVPGWSGLNDDAPGEILVHEPPAETTNIAETIDHPPLSPPSKPRDSPSSSDLAEEYMSELPPGWVDGMQTSDYYSARDHEETNTTLADDADVAAPSPTHAPAPTESGAAAPTVNVEALSSLENARGSVDGYDAPGNVPRTSGDSNRGSTLPPTKSKRRSRDSAVSGSGTLTESGNSTANGKDLDDVSDSDSYYSDAAEDFDDGDGFGSINAIVGGQPEQTTNQTGMAVDKTRPPPLSTREELPSVPEESQVIGRAVSPPLDAGSNWVPDSPDTVDEPLPFSSPYPPFPLKRKPTKPKPPPVIVSRANTNGPKARRPVSMGAVPNSRHGTTAINGATIPRDSSSHTIATSTGPLPQRAGTERRRPVSLGPLSANGAARRQESPPRPTTSNGISQSENRPAEADGTIGHSHNMRRTLRDGPNSPKSPRSPAEDGRPTSAGSGAGTMRSTLRGPPPSTKSNSNKTSFFSTRKSVSKSPTRKRASRGSGPLFSSRFDDSDDEGYGADDRAHNFHSRFADSSDEENGAGANTLRPVRGIPRRHGKEDGESTELEDSSDDEGRRRIQSKTAAAATDKNTVDTNGAAEANGEGLAAVARSRGVAPEELEDFLQHQPNNRKLGIFSRLNLRKSKNNEAKQQLRKSTSEATTVSPDPIAQHNRGGSVTTTVTANGNESPKPRRVSKLLTSNNRQKSAEESWPLRSNRKADEVEEEAVATETKPSAPIHDATINDGDEGAKGSTAVEPPSDASVVPATPAPASAPTSRTAGNQLAGEGSHFPKHENDDDGGDNNNPNPNKKDDDGDGDNNNLDSANSARDVVIAGSGRKKRFPKLRRAFGLR